MCELEGAGDHRREQSVYFQHDPAIWKAFPALAPGVLLVEQVRPDVDVSAQLTPLFERARAQLDLAPADLEITISETPRHNWGIRGLPGDELHLEYKVEV